MESQNRGGIVESARWILQNYLVWLIEVGKRERILLLAKAKSSKNFYALCARFWEFVESGVDSRFVCEILRKAQNLVMGGEG